MSGVRCTTLSFHFFADELHIMPPSVSYFFTFHYEKFVHCWNFSLYFKIATPLTFENFASSSAHLNDQNTHCLVTSLGACKTYVSSFPVAYYVHKPHSATFTSVSVFSPTENNLSNISPESSSSSHLFNSDSTYAFDPCM